MFRHSRFLLVLPCVLLFQLPGKDGPSSIPPTSSKPVTESLHGVSITDPYRWLEDQNSPETRAWISEQQAYTNKYLGAIPGREQVRHKLDELARIDTYGLPTVRGNREFYTKHPAAQNQNQLCIRDGDNGKEEVLVDANALSKEHPVTVRLQDVSHDGSLLIYGLQEGGQDEQTVHLLNMRSRTELNDDLPKARFFQFSALPDGSGFYYSRLLPQGIRLFFHKVGQNSPSDKQVFGEGYKPGIFIGGSVTYDGHWLIAVVIDGFGVKSDIFAMRLGVDAQPKPVIKGYDAYFDPNYDHDHLFAMTTWKAPNRQIIDVDLNHPDEKNWKSIVPESKDSIQSATIVGGRLAVLQLHDVVSRLCLYSLEGQNKVDVKLPSLGTVSGLSGEPDQDRFFFSFTSFSYPESGFAYDIRTNQQSVWWKSPLANNFSDVETEQVWYESRDKTRIPMFLVHKKGFERDGSARVLMTAYGGFDVSLSPDFSEIAAYWVEQGGIYAVPNLRGGGEFGEAWHRAGMFQNKQNVFDDFIAAGEFLVKQGYTSPAKLGIIGMSNGGLLMGAAVTQRPDLFGAVICEYPLLDMVRYDKFKLAQLWVAEYGSAENKDQFQYLFKYSPYHRVEKGTRYPAVLFVTGDGDTRVDPLHARKMTALMQSANASNRPIMLKYDTTSGHSGGKPLSVRVNDETDLMLFLQQELR